ncbi:MAG: hypothetical protein ACREMB_26890 [Candidatus Rokuibacteriota bacterium]
MRRRPARPGGRLAGVAAVWLLAACGLLEPARLDVPPGQHAVLGRVDFAGLDVGEVALEIVKMDGTFREELAIGLGHEDFALVLPAGRYRIVRVRLVKDRRPVTSDPVSEVRLTFQAGPEPAVYIGTLRLRSDLREQVRITVADEYERTVETLRGRYADLPMAIVRRLVTPA